MSTPKKFVNVSVEEDVRTRLKERAAKAGGRTGRYVSTAEIIAVLDRIADRHQDEVDAELTQNR